MTHILSIMVLSRKNVSLKNRFVQKGLTWEGKNSGKKGFNLDQGEKGAKIQLQNIFLQYCK